MMRTTGHKWLLATTLVLSACTGAISGSGRGEGDDDAPPQQGGTASKPPTGGPTATPPVPGTGAAPPSAPGALAPVALRRLTLSQYRNTIEDLFGAGVRLSPIEPEPAMHGFTSVGASTVATSRAAVERYETAAAGIAAQLFSDSARRATLVGCTPAGAEDTACARDFLTKIGRRVYRRPLSAVESDRLVTLGLSVARDHKDFWKGMEAALSALLQCPKFLYRAELGTPASGGGRRFTGYELASRLSFFVLNTTPDVALLDAAGRGELDTAEGVRQAAAKLVASPKARRGLRTFFQELMRLDDPAASQSDVNTLPLPASLVAAIREQTLLTLEDAFLERGTDFAELVRGPTTFLNKELAAHYGVPGPTGTRLERAVLPATGPRTGLMGHAAFLIKMSNQPDSAPTARGKFVREALLCQEVPPPPDGVNTELPPIVPTKPVTMRVRLEGHRVDPACAGCHALTDPIGLGLENFDALGRLRDKEHGLPIDPSGELDGVPFRNARELADAASRHPALAGCFVRQVVRNATGHEEPTSSRSLDALTAAYAQGGKKLSDLIVDLVATDLFLEAGQPL